MLENEARRLDPPMLLSMLPTEDSRWTGKGNPAEPPPRAEGGPPRKAGGGSAPPEEAWREAREEEMMLGPIKLEALNASGAAKFAADLSAKGGGGGGGGGEGEGGEGSIFHSV